MCVCVCVFFVFLSMCGFAFVCVCVCVLSSNSNVQCFLMFVCVRVCVCVCVFSLPSPLSSQVQRFVREWSSLTAMKQRLVRKSGEVFLSPTLLLDQLTSNQRRLSSTKRCVCVCVRDSKRV